MYERLALVNYFTHGAKVGFFRGEVKLLFEDVQALKPTNFNAVPRVLHKIYDKVGCLYLEMLLFIQNKTTDLKKKSFDYIFFQKIRK